MPGPIATVVTVYRLRLKDTLALCVQFSSIHSKEVIRMPWPAEGQETAD